MGKKSRNPRKNNKKIEALFAKSAAIDKAEGKMHEVLTEAKSKLKLAKSKLKEFIIHKNKHKIKLNPNSTKHLKILIELWNNDKDASTGYYFNMKKHTTQINGQIKDEALNKLWRNYIHSICAARCVLMNFEYLLGREMSKLKPAEQEVLLEAWEVTPDATICCGCHQSIQGHGHNGRPLYQGQVCDVCNQEVILHRLG